MCPFVYLEVFGAREDFPATRERAGEGLFASVHANVIHELVLRFEGPAVARAALPEARVRRALGSTDVFHR